MRSHNIAYTRAVYISFHRPTFLRNPRMKLAKGMPSRPPCRCIPGGDYRLWNERIF